MHQFRKNMLFFRRIGGELMNIAYCLPSTMSEAASAREQSRMRAARHWLSTLTRLGTEHRLFRYDPQPRSASVGEEEARLRQFAAANRVDVWLLLVPSASGAPDWKREWLGNTKLAVLLFEWPGRMGELLRTSDLVMLPSEAVRRQMDESAERYDGVVRTLFGDEAGSAYKTFVNEEAAIGRRASAGKSPPYWKTSVIKALELLAGLRVKRAAIVVAKFAGSGRIEELTALIGGLGVTHSCDVYLPELSSPLAVAMRDSGARLAAREEFAGRAGEYDTLLYVLDPSVQDDFVLNVLQNDPGFVLLEDRGMESVSCLEPIMRSGPTIVVHREAVASRLREMGFGRVELVHKPMKLPIMVQLVADRDFIFGCFGKAEPGDGLGEVIAALGRLTRDDRSQARLWIVGECAPQYGEWLLEKAAENGITERVEWIRSTDPRELEYRMSRTDACLYLQTPPPDEPDEALLGLLARGKPVIVRDGSAHAQLPEHVVMRLEAGYLGDGRLYASMQQLSRDAELCRTLRHQAREYMTSRHGVNRFTDRMLSLFSGEPAAASGGEAVQTPEPAPISESEPSILPAATASEPLFAAKEGVTLEPIRYRRLRGGRTSRSCFLFDLSALPDGSTIQSAVLHVPVRGRSLRLHRISSQWEVRGRYRRVPRIRPRPIFSRTRREARGATVWAWDCTELTKLWHSGELANYGVYAAAVPGVRRPWLEIKYAHEGGVQ